MAIQYATPPGDSNLIALTGLQRVAQFTQDAVAVDLTAVRADEAELSAPHKVHHIRLDDLAARRPLRDSPISGWRYLALTRSGAVASSEVSADADGQPTELRQVNMGPYVQSTASSLRDLDEVPEVQDGSYEPHILAIPALSTVIMWLRQLDGDDNFFVPLAPAPGFLEAGRIYREDELLDALEGPARDTLEFDDSPFDPNNRE